MTATVRAHKRKDGSTVRAHKRKTSGQAQVGDGGSPNKYWVQATNDFYICKEGSCDWASDTFSLPPKVSKLSGPFATFEKAKEIADDVSGGMWGRAPIGTLYNTVVIDDRISGQVYEVSIHAYPNKDDVMKGYHYETEEHTDTRFTEDAMAKRGEEFK